MHASVTPLRFPASPRGYHHALRALRERCLLSLIPRLRFRTPRYDQAFGIITYHQVAPAAGSDPGMLNVTPCRFREQLAGLLELGYEPWSLRRVLEYEQASEPIPREVFVLVFDDGFQNIYSQAWPVLRELAIPATVFLATAYLGQTRPFPFDTWTNADPATTSPDVWRPLTVRQCREMSADGLIELGSHTHTHQDFRGRADEFERDLSRSVETLHNQFAVTEPTFSFPYGFADPDLVSSARRAGVRCGLTAECRLVRQTSDPFSWGRFGAVEFDTAGSLAAKLDGWYSRACELWRGLRRGIA